MNIPVLNAGEELHLRFRQWFSYSLYDSGQVQVSVWDPGTSSWGSWKSEGAAIVNTSGWSLKDVELTAYAGKRVRIGFYHTAACYWNNCSDTSTSEISLLMPLLSCCRSFEESASREVTL